MAFSLSYYRSEHWIKPKPNSSPWIGMRVKVKPMKGLLKSLRCISQIFGNEDYKKKEDKEEEFQIGLPTDVKHVVHIGQDAPSANAPSWMSEFKSSPEDLSLATDAVIVRSNQNHTANPSKGASDGYSNNECSADVMENLCGELPPIHTSAGKDGIKKSRSCHLSSSMDSPSRKEKNSFGGRHRSSRRTRNSDPISSSGVPLSKDSSAMNESANGSTRSSRRSRRPDAISEDIAKESPRKKDTSGSNYRLSRGSRKSGPDPISDDTAGQFLSKRGKSGGSSRSSRRTKKAGASEESRRMRKGSSGEVSVRSKAGSSDEGSVRSKAKKDEESGSGSGLRNTNLEMCEEEEGY